MTDIELKRLEAICKVARVKDIGDLSDGFHTFNSLYEQRMILFAALVKAYKDKAWKSYRHEDGELCFGGGWFIVGIDTPDGAYTYHYEEKYFDLFDCVELERSKHWDGHTEKDVTRLLSLPSAQPERQVELDGTESNIEILSELRAQFNCFDEVEEPVYRALTDAICVPSAQPERKEGHWIDTGEAIDDDTEVKCSECGEVIYWLSNFCPNCGADMRGEQDG